MCALTAGAAARTATSAERESEAKDIFGGMCAVGEEVEGRGMRLWVSVSRGKGRYRRYIVNWVIRCIARSAALSRIRVGRSGSISR